MASTEQVQNKLWELSLYELHRTPHATITDNTEIAVSPRSLHSELMCPICLDVLKKTMTTKECLHRFCSDCIITALRSGNKECPTCRKKLVSKRSLRPDPNFDLLISKIYPNRDEYEAHQERVLARLNKVHSQAAFVSSITEGIKLQSQNRYQKIKKNAEDGHSSQGTETNIPVPKEGRKEDQHNRTEASLINLNVPSISTTPSPVPSSISTASKTTSVTKRSKSVLNSERSEEIESSENDRTEGGDSEDTEELEAGNHLNEPHLKEMELIFKPHPTEMTADNILMKALKEDSIRFMKTTNNAYVDHLSKYMAMRLTLDMDTELPEIYRQLNFCIYIWPQALASLDAGSSSSSESPSPSPAPLPEQLVALCGTNTLEQVHKKYWKPGRPLELYYSWRKP